MDKVLSKIQIAQRTINEYAFIWKAYETKVNGKRLIDLDTVTALQELVRSEALKDQAELEVEENKYQAKFYN